MKFPNLLTFFRIIIAPILIIFMRVGTEKADVIAFILYSFACLTDYFDGALARRWKQQSEFGRMIDPIADKVLVSTMLIVLAGAQRLVLYGALFAAVIIMMREIIVSGLREYMALKQQRIHSTKLAKWKTTVQMVSIGFFILGSKGATYIGLDYIPMEKIGASILWVSVILTVATGWDYIRTVKKYIQ